MQIIYLIGIIVLCLVFVVIISYLGYAFKRVKTAHYKIESLFTQILNEHKSPANKFQKNKDKNNCYDYYLETLTTIYYVKVLYNYNCYEISINSRYLWQYKTEAQDEKIRFWPNVVDFVNFNPHDEKKSVVKLCLIYPNSRSLLVYLNESEIAFVRPEQVLYGINFITYERLNSNHNYIEGR